MFALSCSLKLVGRVGGRVVVLDQRGGSPVRRHLAGEQRRETPTVRLARRRRTGQGGEGGPQVDVDRHLDGPPGLHPVPGDDQRHVDVGVEGGLLAGGQPLAM